MSQAVSASTIRENISGWVGVGAIGLAYAALYAANYAVPLTISNYTTRIWNWSQWALTAAALLALILKWRFVKPITIPLGLGLAVLSALSYSLHDSDLLGSVMVGLGVWLCFLGGAALFQDAQSRAVPAFQLPLAKIGRSLIFGVAVAIPLAALNNLYFYMNSGGIRLQNVFYSAFEALTPGISEEIIFRFFILGMCFSLLKSSESRRAAMIASIVLAIVPHSLNHLPDLFLQNPVMGLVMLVATSLLFGLPMALLQVKKNLESAIAFHWLIDFTRFLLGY